MKFLVFFMILAVTASLVNANCEVFLFTINCVTMKFIVFFMILAVTASLVNANCENQLKCFEAQVNELLNQQIQVELTGHYTYLHLSHVFLRHNLYYPKAAKYFKEKADEEMTHAEKFIEYQNRRGGLFDIKPVDKHRTHCRNVDSLHAGFSCAKHLEIDVTRSLTHLLKNVSNVKAKEEHCGSFGNRSDLLLGQPILVTYGEDETYPVNGLDCNNIELFTKVEYVELAEMITHDFLGHQIEDTKELANLESTLSRFGNAVSELGSFLVDKHLEL